MDEPQELEKKIEFLEQMEKIRPDFFWPEAWGDEEKELALEEIAPARTKTSILSSIPMICRGKDCPVAKTCPLLAKGIAPLKAPCPLEMALVVQFFEAYVQELNVDTSRMVEVSMVRSLVDQEVQYVRKTKLLASEDFIQENIVSIDSRGNPVFKKELHLAIEWEDKIQKRMERLRSQLLATRESRAKVGQGMLDTAQTISRLLEEREKIDREKEKLIRKKLGKELVDDYIEADIVDPD